MFFNKSKTEELELRIIKLEQKVSLLESQIKNKTHMKFRKYRTEAFLPYYEYNYSSISVTDVLWKILKHINLDLVYVPSTSEDIILTEKIRVK